MLNGEAELGEKVCLIDYDGHHRATATAEFMANQGKTVHIITSSLFVGAELGPTQDLYLTRQRLLQKGVTFTPDIAVMEVGGETGAKTRQGRSTSTPTLGRVGAVRLHRPGHGAEGGRRPLHGLKGKVPELYRIGDSVAPRKVDMAIWEGHRIGREI